MGDKRIVNYLKEGRDKGYTFDSLKQKLIESGFSEKEIDKTINYLHDEGGFKSFFLEYLRVHSAIFLRISMAFMYLWFGIQQIINPQLFLGFLPSYAEYFPLSPLATIYSNGAFEILFASVLLLGIFVRFTALILSLHLYVIGISLGFNGLMVRDVALATAIFVIFLNGEDKWCLPRLLRKKKIKGII